MRAFALVALAGCGGSEAESSTPLSHAAPAGTATFHCVTYRSMPGSWCVPTAKECEAVRQLVLAGLSESERGMTCAGAEHAYCFDLTAGDGSTKQHCSRTMDHCERELKSGSLRSRSPCRLVRRPPA